jgi:hypothetical protein
MVIKLLSEKQAFGEWRVWKKTKSKSGEQT